MIMDALELASSVIELKGCALRPVCLLQVRETYAQRKDSMALEEASFVGLLIGCPAETEAQDKRDSS
jgi:hypothetical protein